MCPGGQGSKWRRNNPENFNRLSWVHERYRRRQADDRRTGNSIIANVNVSSRSLKTDELVLYRIDREFEFYEFFSVEKKFAKNRFFVLMFWNVTFIYNAFIRTTNHCKVQTAFASRVVKNYTGSLLPGTRRVPGYPRQPYTRAFNEFLTNFYDFF